MKSLNNKTRKLLVKFHDGQLTLDQLRDELLKINPYKDGEMEHGFYVDHINESISQYISGDTYVLDLNSSGSILDN